MDDPAGTFTVGLSFGGIPTTLVVPFRHVSAFADPHVQFGLRFTQDAADAANDEPAETRPYQPTRTDAPPEEPVEPPQVVSLDAFRKRPPSKE